SALPSSQRRSPRTADRVGGFREGMKRRSGDVPLGVTRSNRRHGAQPSTARIWVAAAIKASASLAVMSLPRCALTPLMKDCNGPQAAAVLSLCNLSSAVVSLASSAFFVPDLVARLLTAAIRSLVCSAAPFTWTLKLHDD